MFRFASRQALRWVDVDAFGVVNNAVYLSLFEQARYEYCRELAILREGQIAFVLGETRARYLRPGRLGMDLTVFAKTVRLGTKSFDMEFEVCDPQGVLVLGWATLVWVDENLRSRTIPEQVRQAIAAYEGIAAAPRSQTGK